MLQQAIESIKGKVVWRTRYDNFIGGAWVPPKGGEYFTNTSPITGKPVAEIARSRAEDVELALDA
ncbi:MAG: aldehyde dehydrogenase, partial [Rhodomicrobium sp.]